MNSLLIILPPAFIVAGYTEMKHRRIPNWLTVSTLLCGMAGSLILYGPEACKHSLIGLLIGGGVFLPFCLTGVLGGGDVKLMAAVGAVIGHPMIWWALFYTIYAGGGLSLIYLAWSGQLLSGIGRSFRLLLGRRNNKPKGLRKVTTIPYGVAIAVGTVAALVYETPL